MMLQLKLIGMGP